MTCKNCGQNFEGNFCNNCGQNSNVQKINLSYLVDEISNSVLQVNRGILFTIKELFIRPGHSIREFLEGKRKQHFKPLAFVLLVSTVYVLLTYFTGTKTFLGDTITGISEAISSKGQELSKSVKILNWLANNYAYSTLLLLPIFSFASYLSFKKAKYNYFEHLILNFYITGQQIVIYLIFTFLFYAINSESYLLQGLPFIFSLLFTFFVFIQFFKSQKLVTKIFHTLLTYILYYIFIGIFMSLIGI